MNFTIPQNDLDHILENINLEKFRDKNIFITGATGFFGKWILEGLCYANLNRQLGLTICALTRDSNKFLLVNPHFSDIDFLRFLEGDVRFFYFPEENFDYVIHGATDANITLNIENPILMLDTIIDGTKRVLEFSKLTKASRFLFISSGAVYGKRFQSDGSILETSNSAPLTTDPSAAYGEGKRLAEFMCLIRSREKLASINIARCFAFYGPHLPLNSHFAFGNFLLNILSAEDLYIKGDGTALRSYLYAADLVIWLLTILVEGRNECIYNVGSDNLISILDLGNKMASYANNQTQVVIAKSPIPGADPELYVPNIDRAKSELSLKVLINIDEGIKRTLEWQKRKY